MMCSLYSAILTKNYDVLDTSNDSHEDIIKAHSLKDLAVGAQREWLRVEVLPLVSLESVDFDEWEYHLDEDGTGSLPDWYNAEMAEKYCKQHLFQQLNNGRYKGVWLGYIRISKGSIEASALTTAGNVYVYGSFEAPALTTAGNVYVSGSFEAPALTTAGNVSVSGSGSFKAPALTTAGNVDVYGSFEAPLLKR